MGKHRRGSTMLGLLIPLGAVWLAGCGGGGSTSGDASAASLAPRLLPAAALPGFRQQRTFDWRDPVDLIVEGLRLPEITRPSSAVKIFNDAGFQGGAGERLTMGTPPDESEVTVGVLKFKSPDGARQARDWMHGQDLQQPCFAACIYTPRNLAIPAVPTATAVQQIPNSSASTGGEPGPPTVYLAEFTVGQYLYFSWLFASPKDAGRFVAGTQRYYRSVQKLPD